MVKLSSVSSKYFVLFVFAIVLFYIPTGRSLIIITHWLLKTSRVTPMYSSSCNNLSGVMKGLQSDYYMQSFDAELKASTCIQNAWRLQDHQAGSNSTGYFDSGYVNGWT